ncbi:hypothetical protein D9758_010811 [Tetrapyrgos nigripes]|uniref:Uncharacterized protein n=1 Tax=Tetrapyrgos nigripes TaxID=182062 RepID=A0A8H5GI81_9AGAR|nr:hypothetical protein D9758_010811 [Tetrapyrgos nigripes]
MSSRPPSYATLPDGSQERAQDLVTSALEQTHRDRPEPSIDTPPAPPLLQARLADSNQHQVPFGVPPARAERPETNVRYTLSPMENDPSSLLLLPSAESPNTRPKFQIKTVVNPLNPNSFVTTIHQGATANGRFIGAFEMSSNRDPLYEWVSYGNLQQQAFFYVLDIAGFGAFTARNPVRPRNWKYRDYEFYWCWENGGFTRCYATDPQSVSTNPDVQPKLYAKYSPRRLRIDRSLGTAYYSVALEELEVTPEGHEVLDQILLSLMIIERRRLLGYDPKANVI